MAVLVVIPTYDEAENIARTLDRVRAAVPAASVLVVDDASPDGTGVIAERLASADPAVHVLHRPLKQGLGSAYLAAFEWAFERDYAVIVQLDADGSHQPEQLPALLARLAGADLVIGSRWVPGGGVVNWPRHREWLSRGGSAYARALLRLPERDVTAGYRVFRASALRAMRLDDVHTRGYGFQVDMLWHAHAAGLTIVEEPIEFVEREFGRSKMTAGIVVEAILRVTGWGVRSLFPRSRGMIRAGGGPPRSRRG